MHQDWTPVVLRKRNIKPKAGTVSNASSKRTTTLSREQRVNQARQSGETVTVEKKFLGGCNKTKRVNLCPNAAAIENDTDNLKVDRVCFDFAKSLQQARAKKKLTQAELAQAINEKASVINDYESGKAIPNNQIIQKLNRALGITLPKAVKK